MRYNIIRQKQMVVILVTCFKNVGWVGGDFLYFIHFVYFYSSQIYIILTRI